MKYTTIRKATTKTKQISPDSLGRDVFTYVDISSVDRETKRISEPKETYVTDAPSRARKEIQSNDILVSTVRPNLNAVAYVSNEYDGEIASTGFCILRSKSELLDPKYLFYFTQSKPFIEHLTRHSIGAGYPAVTDNVILDMEIPLPPLAAQERIAGILARADRLRQLRRTALQLSAGYLQAVFLQLFGDPVTNPMGWEIRPLRDLIDSFEGGVNFPPVSEGDNASDWRVLKISSVTWGEFNPLESKPIRPNVKFDESLIVRKGDLIIGRANTTELVGAVSMVRQIPPKVLLPDKLWRIKIKENSDVLPDFVLFVLRQNSLRKIIGDLATGSSGSMKNISMAKAATLPIPITPIELQKQFTCIVERFERLRSQQHEAARQADHLFATLLHRAFRGEL